MGQGPSTSTSEEAVAAVEARLAAIEQQLAGLVGMEGRLLARLEALLAPAAGAPAAGAPAAAPSSTKLALHDLNVLETY